jgi:hypothetical protein
VRALKGAILRGYGDHRRQPWWTFARYARALQARLGPLPADARPWVREAGLLVVALDALHAEEATLRASLADPAVGRRLRAKHRTALSRLERRAMRLRASLEAAERRLADLAGGNGHGRPTPDDLLRQAHAAMAAGRTEAAP